MNGVTYSTFEEDEKRFDTNDEDFMTKTSECRNMLAEYEAVMKEEKDSERIIQMETYVENGSEWKNVKNVYWCSENNGWH